MSNFWIEVIGVTAAVLTTSAFVPQAYKIYKYQISDGVSLTMYFVMLVGVSIWLVYGILLGKFAIILANTITLIIQLFIIYQKLKHLKTRNRKF
ncbi:MAG: SemiSWEET transporter [Flavobacteriaceae bacterium]|nr:SemiSWEET transporter [Flavobacteriaceae bacterium]MCY4215919.1 SemiSWEET transporter [Flavobacteriaceae bacterium]MCY4253811.1 SemiSWEET transporter [Flavobacteriaceae bacterium]